MEPKLKVSCMIEDTVQHSSPFWGEHGLSFLIETGDRRVLFDTGQSGTALLHNLDLVGVDPATIDALAISHGHHDHTGGLPALLGHLRPGTPLYANPDLFRERFSQKEGQWKAVGLSVKRARLARRLTLRLSVAPQEIIPGLWTTGEISERPEPEGRSASHLMREEGSIIVDAYRDDMALVWHANDRLALLCGCCHAGLLNTIVHTQRAFQQDVQIIVGGLHLASATPSGLRHITDVLKAMTSLEHVYPNHCTGEAAFVALVSSLGSDVVHPCPAGTILEF